MKKPKTLFIISIILLIISVIFAFLVKNFDVAEIGETATTVGFSSFNNSVFQAIGTNFTLYKITEIVGFLPILVATGYAILGLAQLIKRKNLLKVDHGILALGGLLAVTLVLYILFDKIAWNYRPVFVNGELEASFPSSHTMLIIIICSSIILLNSIYYSKNKFAKILNFFLAFLVAFIVAGRFLAGVHWATDIIGGLLFALTLLTFYTAVLEKTKKAHC